MRATLALTYHLKRLGKCGYPYTTHMLCYEAGFIEPQSKSLNSSLTLHIPKDGKFATYATVEVILKRALNYNIISVSDFGAILMGNVSI